MGKGFEGPQVVPAGVRLHGGRAGGLVPSERKANRRAATRSPGGARGARRGVSQDVRLCPPGRTDRTDHTVSRRDDDHAGDQADDEPGPTGGASLSGTRLRGSPLGDRYVAGAVLVQLAGYAALSALVPYGEFSAVVSPLRGVPPVVLLPFAVLAIPALLLAVLAGSLLSLVGLDPSMVLVLGSVYVVGVGAASVWRSLTGTRNETAA
jgi:hypothetical protein